LRPCTLFYSLPACCHYVHYSTTHTSFFSYEHTTTVLLATLSSSWHKTYIHINLSSYQRISTLHIISYSWLRTMILVYQSYRHTKHLLPCTRTDPDHF
jgi:hypothetical protein